MPMPRTTTAGKKVFQYAPPIPGLRKSAKPDAATSGPTVSGSLAPYRATRPPDQRESTNISRIRRKQRGSGLRRGVMLDLNEIKRKEKQDAAERRVEQEREQVGSGKVSGPEKMQRDHRSRRA